MPIDATAATACAARLGKQAAARAVKLTTISCQLGGVAAASVPQCSFNEFPSKSFSGLPSGAGGHSRSGRPDVAQRHTGPAGTRAAGRGPGICHTNGSPVLSGAIWDATGAGDLSPVFGDDALADVRTLVAKISPDDLGAMQLIGMTHWLRYLVLPAGEGERDLAAAVEWLGRVPRATGAGPAAA